MANIIENKRTDRRTTNENESPWEALANKYADVTKRTHKQLEACWKNFGGKKHRNLDASVRKKKKRLRTGGRPLPGHPVAQTVGDIL